VTVARSPSTEHAGDGGIEHDLHAEPAGHLVAQGVGEVGVELHQQALAAVDQRDADAEGGEDAGVLAADHAAADHDESPRDGGEGEDVVAVHDHAAVEGDLGGVRGAGAGGEEERRRR
jgi:hypothetical protein